MDNILITESSTDYELLDSGGGEKLERYGKTVLSRPDPQAIWSKKLSDEWSKADAVFTRTSVSGKWKINNDPGEDFSISLEDLTFSLKLLPSKHLGVFPEQSAHWKWLREKIEKEVSSERKVSVLNLFGYTGGASLACAKAGASVCHVDSSEFAVDLAHKNMELSGLSEKEIRFIVDDAKKFVEREIKRGNKYDIILLDPPVYGKGVKKEIWNIEEDLAPLLLRLKNLMSDNFLSMILNGYASGYSYITYAELLSDVTGHLGGTISAGELAIRETSGKRLLPSGIFAKYEN